VKLSGVVLVLQNLQELRQGLRITQDQSYLERPLATRTRGHRANFEESVLLAVEVSHRLKFCGRDGFILKVHCALDESEQSIAHDLDMAEEAVGRGIRTALKYVSGKWPKRENYRDYRARNRY